MQFLILALNREAAEFDMATDEDLWEDDDSCDAVTSGIASKKEKKKEKKKKKKKGKKGVSIPPTGALSSRYTVGPGLYPSALSAKAEWPCMACPAARPRSCTSPRTRESRSPAAVRGFVHW